MHFQRWCFGEAQGPVLNVGCCDGSIGFEDKVTNFDLDDWSELYTIRGWKFVQGDAHRLTEYFEPGSFDLVVMGDIIEHLPDPYLACGEAAQVSKRLLCMTIWEEWRLPKDGKHVHYAQQHYEAEAKGKGYTSGSAMYASEHPGCTPADNLELSHWGHCWQFTEEMIHNLVAWLCAQFQMEIVFFERIPEVMHLGHMAHNWLVLLTKEASDEE